MKKFILILFALVFLVGSVSSLMPPSHAYLVHDMCQQNYSTDFARMCCADEKACISGVILDDVSIFFYLERGLKKYTVTHSTIFCENGVKVARTEGENAFSAGLCFHHPPDIVSHNILVPYAIENTGLKNVWGHPPAEQKIDNWIQKNHPEANKILQGALEVAPQYIEFMSRILQPNPEYQSVDVQKLSVAFLQQVRDSKTGYDVGYRGYGFETLAALPLYIYLTLILFISLSLFFIVLIIFKTQLKFWNIFTASLLFLAVLVIIIFFIATALGNVWSLFTSVISPISNFVPTPEPRVIVETAQNHMQIMAVYGTNYVKNLPQNMQDVTGVGTSSKPGNIVLAEQKTWKRRIVYYVIGVILIVLFFWLNWRTRKSKI